MIHTEDKPPLTRRWTFARHGGDFALRQTSAHAEMDPWDGMDNLVRRPNLRSRGDGPLRVALRPCGGRKPPLTRRWTHLVKVARVPEAQTSAHAEMDPAQIQDSCGMLANLRSRGDGPLSTFELFFARAKPPLTRRWTLILSGKELRPPQTSAHAEMDPCVGPGRETGVANLRSRGDGPLFNCHFICQTDKPPLTRRWTDFMRGDKESRNQTSAHAEMDPRRRPYTARRRPNLRSRGDGPTRSTVSPDIKSKPPLTRRWTLDELRILGE